MVTADSLARVRPTVDPERRHGGDRRRQADRRGRRDAVAFVLSGGGNLGALQVGMLRALLEARVTPDLIVGCSVGAINGASIARKTSFLKDKLGAQLFASNIRIIDDPLRKRGLRSQPFDAEGVVVKRTALIDQGVLTTWLLDCATARELGLSTTGHAHRGVSSSPSPGPQTTG